MEMDMNVGDVLYLYTELNKRKVLLPIRICERTVRQSISETVEFYSVEIPGEESKVSMEDLHKLGTVYDTLEHAHAELMSTAEESINKMIQTAQGVCDKYYAPSHPIDSSETQNDMKPVEENESLDS
jgi:hypothetical protein